MQARREQKQSFFFLNNTFVLSKELEIKTVGSQEWVNNLDNNLKYSHTIIIEEW